MKRLADMRQATTHADPMDRRIVIETRSKVLTDTGNEELVWTPLATVWAEWVRGTRTERQETLRQTETVTDTFRTRWSPRLATLETTARLRFDGRAYDIIGVVERGRREVIEITAAATERTP